MYMREREVGFGDKAAGFCGLEIHTVAAAAPYEATRSYAGVPDPL